MVDRIEWVEQELPAKPVYRLYYSSDGKPTAYTCDDLPGAWIEVTKEQYAAARFDATVVDGVLVNPQSRRMIGCYTRNPDSGVSTSKYDINILTDVECNYWKYESYEIK